MILNHKKEQPIIIGGFPGSGTRIVCQIVKDAGVYMGKNLNKANDALDFDLFLIKWINFFLENTVNEQHMKDKMEREFESCLRNHLLFRSKDHKDWGFKIPRIIVLLPFLHTKFPKMKFIHVIRDGRDLSISKNPRWRIKQIGRILLGRSVSTPSDILDLWSVLNTSGADFGRKKMKDNYLQVRFEDLCEDPNGTIFKIYQFLNIINNNLLATIKKVNPPAGTIGRWKKHNSEFKNFSRSTKDTLRRFGYV